MSKQRSQCPPTPKSNFSTSGELEHPSSPIISLPSSPSSSDDGPTVSVASTQEVNYAYRQSAHRYEIKKFVKDPFSTLFSPEIRARIFLFCSPPADIVLAQPQELLETALSHEWTLRQLASVCHGWRQMITSVHLLWTTLVINLSVFAEDPMSEGYFRVRMARAGGHPLSLIIYNGNFTEVPKYSFTRLVSLTNHNCDRWQGIHVEGVLDFQLFIGELDGDFPLLDSFSIVPNPGDHRHNTLYYPDTIEMIEKPEPFKFFACCFDFQAVRVDWASATDITLADIRIGEFGQLLRYAPNLQRLKLNRIMSGVIQDDEEAKISLEEESTHHALEELQFMLPQPSEDECTEYTVKKLILNRIPYLKKFEMHQMVEWELVETLMQQWCTGLETLILSFQDPGFRLMDVLYPAHISLVHLEITACQHSHVIPSLITEMAQTRDREYWYYENDEDDEIEWNAFLPSLKSLVCKMVPKSPGIDWEALVNVFPPGNIQLQWHDYYLESVNIEIVPTRGFYKQSPIIPVDDIYSMIEDIKARDYNLDIFEYGYDGEKRDFIGVSINYWRAVQAEQEELEERAKKEKRLKMKKRNQFTN